MKEKKIALGTAAFGLDYGITNKEGKVKRSEAVKIIKKAIDYGINTLDTAQVYGNAEEIIGLANNNGTEVEIITKMKADCGKEGRGKWETELNRSMQTMRTEKLKSLMVHNAEDIKGEQGKKLLSWLQRLREDKVIEKIGVSIYTEKDLEGLPLDNIQLIQLPSSIYDQRVIDSGAVQKIKEKEIEIHVRSIYLQGLIITPSSNWPKWINPAFRKHHEKLEISAIKKRKSLVELAVSWAMEQDWIDAIVVGCTKEEELEALAEALKTKTKWKEGETKKWSWENEIDIDPRRWTNK